MMKYKIAGTHFHHAGEHELWNLMKKGFTNSVKRNTKAELDLRILSSPEPPSEMKAKKKFVSNNHKLKEWRNIVYQSDCPVVLMDTDIIVLDDIDGAFSEHITLTERGKKWFNGGVIFANPTEETKKFFDAWVAIDEWMYNNPNLKKKETKRHGVLGQNQVALRTLYDDWPGLFSWVSCKQYNACEDNYWHSFEKNQAKVIHVKSALQKAVFKYYETDGKKRKKYHHLLDRIFPYYEDQT